MKRLSILAIVLITVVFSVTAQEKSEGQYPNKIGHLRLNTIQLMLQNVSLTETKTDTLKVLNEWDQPINIQFTKLPEYIKCTPVPAALKPGQKGFILVSYDGSKRNDFGSVYDTFVIETNDSLDPEKRIRVVANLFEDFSKMTPKQLKDAPKIEFENAVYDFGTIIQGDKIEYDFIFKNTGKNDLIIRKTKASCGCTVGTPEKSILKSGEKSKFHVVFNSAGKSGQQSKTITITCNDPSNSSAIVTIKGIVNVATKPIAPKE